MIREAILRELARGGQVFFVHNRVETSTSAATARASSCPRRAIVVGARADGRGELEKAMLDFMHGRCDVLVRTAIIEAGLDIPTRQHA